MSVFFLNDYGLQWINDIFTILWIRKNASYLFSSIALCLNMRTVFYTIFFFRFYSSHPHFHYSLIFLVQFLFICLGWFVVFFFFYFSFKFIVCIFLIILSLNFISLFYVVIWSAILLRRMRQNHFSLSLLTEIYIFLFWLRAVLSIL